MHRLDMYMYAAQRFVDLLHVVVTYRASTIHVNGDSGDEADNKMFHTMVKIKMKDTARSHALIRRMVVVVVPSNVKQFPSAHLTNVHVDLDLFALHVGADFLLLYKQYCTGTYIMYM